MSETHLFQVPECTRVRVEVLDPASDSFSLAAALNQNLERVRRRHHLSMYRHTETLDVPDTASCGFGKVVTNLVRLLVAIQPRLGLVS